MEPGTLVGRWDPGEAMGCLEAELVDEAYMRHTGSMPDGLPRVQPAPRPGAAPRGTAKPPTHCPSAPLRVRTPPRVRKRVPMFLMSKKPRRTNRTKSNRYRAKLKAKNRGRRNRVYQRG